MSADPERGGFERPAGEFRHEVLPWPDAFERYRGDWSRLVDRRGLNPSLLPDWQAILVDSHAGKSNTQVLVQTCDGAFSGALPFRFRNDRVNGLPVRLLEPVSSILSYHCEFVCRHDPRILLRALLAAVANEPWQLLRLTSISEGSDSASATEEVMREAGHLVLRRPGESSPWLAVNGSFAEIVAARPKRKRYQFRRRARDFAELPDSRCEWLQGREAVSDFLAAMETVEQHSWKADAGIAIYSDPRQMHYLRELLGWLADHDAIIANLLWAGDTPIAYDLFCVWNGWAGNLKGSYHRDYASLSPGALALDLNLERCCAAGAREIDFLGQADAYKYNWADKNREHSDFFVFRRGSRGYLLGAAQRLRDSLSRFRR